MIAKRIAVLPGDGIGPEVIGEATKVLGAISRRFNHVFSIEYADFGACAIDKSGEPFPDTTKVVCENAHAILLGAIGHPKFDGPGHAIRPEQGLLTLRKELGLYANIRPVKYYEALSSASPLKKERVIGTDIIVVRELTGGIYFGEKERKENYASDKCSYSRSEIERILSVAFGLASNRNKKVTLVDKANVLETSMLWRRVFDEVAMKYHDIETQRMYVDNAAMQLILNPSQFDVIVTENLFGDILTDEASVISGSLGLIPSASIGTGPSLYEPIHGSYPQAAGKNIANPIGAILSVAMMLEMSFGLEVEAAMIQKAVFEVIKTGTLTKDLSPVNFLSTSEFGDRVAANIFDKVFDYV